jgi:hypothetical protein
MLDSPNFELGVWRPSCLEDVYFPLEVEIGEVGAEGADLFADFVHDVHLDVKRK